MRKFRIEFDGKVHIVSVEEVKAENEAEIAVIAAAIAGYSEEETAPPSIVTSRWSLAGKFDSMAPVSGGRKVPRWAKGVSSGWRLAGRKRLMRQIDWEVWDEEV